MIRLIQYHEQEPEHGESIVCRLVVIGARGAVDLRVLTPDFPNNHPIDASALEDPQVIIHRRSAEPGGEDGYEHCPWLDAPCHPVFEGIPGPLGRSVLEAFRSSGIDTAWEVLLQMYENELP